jgi:AcrR family transcriptional regulator
MGLKEVFVPGYRDGAMGGKKGSDGGGRGVRTPWGYAGELREMKMQPGRGNAPEDSERSQRERLFGAMVALSAEQGYEATKIGELVKLAGVSRAAFYDHFKDKQELMLAAVEALLEPTIALIERAEDAGTGEARVRQAVEAFMGLIAKQPAASKMCFIEIYAAGPAGEAEVERVLDLFERFCIAELNQIPDRKGTPPQMVRAMLGGLQKVIHKRLYSDEPDQLPRLAEDIATWGLSRRTPSSPPSTAAPLRCWASSCPPSGAQRAGRSRCGPPTRRCSPSASKSPSTRRSGRCRCTRRGDGPCRPATRSWKASRPCSRPATSASRTSRR